VRQLSPALATHYLQRHLRSRAEARERERLARELHDGVTQSLAALEVQFELVRQHAEAVDTKLSSELAQARALLHEEVLGMRDLMQRIRPIDTDPRRLPQELRGLVERFTMTSGIQGRLDWAAGTLDITPRQAQELFRIVQEALVNVRRHSGASRAVVWVGSDASGWELVIEDDGRGFGFTGQLSHEELVASGKGPRVIRERVEALGGTLDLVSSAAGARLEMLFPRRPEALNR
jgi:signal transduction histidine kinase